MRNNGWFSSFEWHKSRSLISRYSNGLLETKNCQGSIPKNALKDISNLQYLLQIARIKNYSTNNHKVRTKQNNFKISNGSAETCKRHKYLRRSILNLEQPTQSTKNVQLNTSILDKHSKYDFISELHDIKWELVHDNKRTSVTSTNSLKEHTKNLPPGLVYGLSKVLHQPVSLHQLKDQRSGVYSYDSRLENIMFDSSGNKPQQKAYFTSPNKDETLHKIAKEFDKSYVSSTSSLTSILSHLHFLLSNFRQLNIIDSPISKNFPQKHTSFSPSASFPASFILRKGSNGVISISSDKSLDREFILSELGHVLEGFLTERREKNQTTQESFHYSSICDFIVRSQLDAYDARLPGTGIFDLKTRACAAVRHDLSYVEKNQNQTGYNMTKVRGEFESLEREFYDLIRTTSLKYSLQARIGVMDGIFVAYHNISKIFGFQYLPLEELDFILHSAYSKEFEMILEDRNNFMRAIYGDTEFILHHQRDDRQIATVTAVAEFKHSMYILNKLLNAIQDHLKAVEPEWESCKVLLQTRKGIRSIQTQGTIESSPNLEIVVLPLMHQIEDTALTSKGKTNDEIIKEIDDLCSYNKRLAQENQHKLFGFNMSISHDYHSKLDAESVRAALKESQVKIPRQLHEFITSRLARNYYDSIKKWDTPNFIDLEDIDTWKINATLLKDDDTARLLRNYSSLVSRKSEELKSQCMVKEIQESKYDLISRLRALYDTEVMKRKPSRPQKPMNHPTSKQIELRAYGLKGECK